MKIYTASHVIMNNMLECSLGKFVLYIFSSSNNKVSVLTGVGVEEEEGALDHLWGAWELWYYKQVVTFRL